MILEVLSDRKVNNRLDAHLIEVPRRPDARQHQQLRTIECPAGKDHLAVAASTNCVTPPDIFDTDRASALEKDARCMCLGEHGEVRSPTRRPEVGRGSR